ncbi:MAG TPA: helix-turn-helix domain-containing protein [Solirubrobacterales bacterium]|nr:helix-turn-helix domain-containing protein [Solirubrobacterales bacterium]
MGSNDSPHVDWEHISRLEMHPRRFGLLQILSLDGSRTLSPNECAYELHTNVADANYHMTVLAESGIVRQAHAIPVRGTKEHFYCLVGHSADDLFERLRLPPPDH